MLVLPETPTPGITTSWTKNPPEEGDSAGNYKLFDEEST
jgi:hypothetical protein